MIIFCVNIYFFYFSSNIDVFRVVLSRKYVRILNVILICKNCYIISKNAIKSEQGEIVATVRSQSGIRELEGILCFLTDLADKGWSLEYILEGEKLTGWRIMMSRRDREDNLNNYGIEFEGQWRETQLNKAAP